MKVELVLFDLGGVLLGLNGVEEFAGMVGTDSEDALWELWLSSPWVQRFERGHCDAEAFAAGMVESLSLRCDPGTFLERFATWPGDFIEGTHELVAEVSARVPTACLSNTNVVHFDQVLRPAGVEALFPTHFLSFQMGHLKPDAEAFQHVLERTGTEPGAVLFLDDNRINADAAQRLGLRAEVAKSPTEARAALERAGLL